MRNLYNMSIPVVKATRVSLTEQSSEKFRTALRKVKTKFVSEPFDLADIIVDVKDVNEAIIEQPEVQDVEVKDFLDINDLKVAELREILDSKGVEYTVTKKDDLIKLVKEV